MNTGRFFALIVALTIPLAVSNAWGKGTYTDEETKTIIANSIKEIQAFYPGKKLHITEEFNFDDGAFFETRVDGGTAQRLCSITLMSLELRSRYLSRYNSAAILEMLDQGEETFDFTLRFSFPFQGIMVCEVVPFDGRYGMLGGTDTIQNYLIRFDDDGEVFQITRINLLVD